MQAGDQGESPHTLPMLMPMPCVLLTRPPPESAGVVGEAVGRPLPFLAGQPAPLPLGRRISYEYLHALT